MSQLLITIIQIAATIVLIAFVARFLAQLGRADFHNPLAQTVFSITNPILKPLRRIIPGLGGLDVASLVVLYVGQILFAGLILALLGNVAMIATPNFFIWGLLSMAGIFIMVIKWSMIIVAVASFILAGHNPFIHFISQMIEHLLPISPLKSTNWRVRFIFYCRHHGFAYNKPIFGATNCCKLRGTNGFIYWAVTYRP